jgi:amino acid adenylation domain-containing protein
MNSVATLTDLTPAQRLELLKMARARKLVGDRSELPPIQPAGREGRLPLSFAQERLWFVDQLEPGSTVYNLPSALRLTGTLDVGALERALGEIVRRHEALRTVFAEVDGSPVQVVAPFGGFALPVEDLSGLDEADRDAAVGRRVGEEALQPFDLSAGPLFRALLLRLGAEEHVLLLAMHHIVSDAWSMGVLSREFSVLYTAYSEGRESPLPELAVQYADYAVWQREQLEGPVLDRQLAYWRERLAGAPELLELPTDHPRPAVQAHRGATVPVELSPELLEGLQALGRSEGATLYMVALAAFQVLLSKYSGSDDIVVGSPIAGRERDEVKGLIGFFVNTLVLRTDLSGDPSFREVLRRVREVTLGAYERQEVSFEKLVAELSPERSLGHSPLFQVSFTLDNAQGTGGRLAGLGVQGVETESEVAKFDLSLSLAETAQGLRGGLNYSTDLFERGTIERMLGHLARVMEQVAADADVRLSRLALAGPEERARVVVEWNRTERPYPRGVCIHELFDAQVRERPEAAALVWGEESLTYRELDARANQLANHLVRLGVGPDVRVGVLLERSAELIVSILAVLKAGGAYVPLDPGYPAERLRLMLADSSVRVLLSRGELAEVVEAGGLAVVRLDQAAGALASESAEAPRSGATPENLAYIVYTSGSTGKPKGVMVAHRHVVQLVVETDYVRFRPGDRVAQASNASFDALTFEAWGALMNGATLVGIPRDVLLSPAAFREMLREERITTLYQTTALLNQLSREQPDVFAPLREVLFGGQAADADSVRRLLKAGGPERLLHMYGPTETTAWCSWEQVTHVAEDALTVSVGRATGNQRIYLLDSVLDPVPVGVPGEAYVGGDGVVRGYLDRPGLTAERFLPDPFAAEPGARMYRTGDRLRWKADGRLEFIGRVDEQVKVRGFRIEPGEIEARLTAHAGVHEARVIVREDEPGEQRLVAYVVGEADAEALRAHLRESLPEYMVPAAFVALERIPLTPNGKLDVKALPAPDLASAEDRYVAPRTPVEEVLAGIWAEVLRLERVGVHDSFFELGGHSLLATRVVSRIRELLGAELPLRAFFEGPTVAELAGRVEELRRAELPVLPPVVAVDRTGALPMSFAQERLWFIDRLEPGSAVYNIPAALRLAGALDEAALERALGEIVRRHEALRTVFAEVDGSQVQVIAPFGGFALPVEDLSGLGEADREATAGRRAGEEAARPFDLSAGPLFRAALLRLGAEDHVLLLSMHHIVSDGWSLGVLFRELSALYAAYREGRESPLSELPVQYADYAVWQREQLAGEALERQLAYWRAHLEGAPELLELPTDHPRPAVQTHRGASVPVELSPELLERLQRLGRSEGATLYMTLLGAFQVLLGRYAGSRDVVVGSPIAGRTRGEVEALIGFFVNTLVLRTDLSGDPSFRETLRRVRDVTLGAYEHQEVPFEKLVAELSPERSLSHSPLFQVMFMLQDVGGGGGALPGLQAGGVGVAMEVAKFDLSLTLAVTPQGLLGGLTYSTDLFERGTVERMVGHLERVLEQAAADADVRLSQLELLGDAERALVLEAWNRADAEYPAHPCIHERFEAQAARTPAAVAVVYEGEALSYAELNARANRLAHHLRRRGVGPEVRVGICLERSLEMVVSILAVLKAGGAYVPLDPAYPAERVAFTLSDAGVPVVLAQEKVRATLAVPEGVELISLDGAAEEIAAESAENPRSGATPESLAYVIYTSGSTGTPKGALIEHRNVARLFTATDAWFGFGPDDVWTLFHSCAFDFSVWELWGALLYGGRVVVVPFDVSRDPEAFHALVQREGVTVLNQTPSAFRQFIRVDGERGGELALRNVIFGGEALEPATLREWVERRGTETPRLVNMYGITETTVHVTYRPLGREDVFGGSRSPIGRAIPDLRLYVLDPARRPVPVGVPGELYVGGAGVARGYLNRPELTAERFVDDPFAPGRLYRTGDQVRWMADGTLEYLGRLDEQVKIRGFRIELGEIEARLAEYAGVREAVVLVREDEPGEKRLVAYVVGSVETDALRGHLRDGLPEYMVPAAFVVLDALPLTANGKLDRKALPAPELASAEETYVAPRTPVEEVLAGIWAEMLRLERVGVEESFFELGGHSLLATRVISRVREVFGVELPLRALFEGPTVAELAGRVEEMRRAELPVLPPVVPTERTDALPLSFAQERLWFIDRLEPASTVYNVPMAWRLGGALDEAALERSLGEIVRRHEALRTTFGEVNGSPVQVIAPFGGFALPVEDLSGLGEADRGATLRRRAGEEAARPFDLAAGPLFRAVLLRLDAEDNVLLVSMHHIVSDGWSTGVLLRELSALYATYREGGESPLPELAVQYADYAVWQREHLAGEALDRLLAYWKGRLGNAPALLELPTDHPRPAVQTYRGALVPFELSPELLERLQALGRSEGATLYMTLLGAFQVLLSKYSGSDDIVVGSPIAGRTRGEVEALIGFFVNTLVLRTDLSGDPSFRETVRRVRDLTLGAYEHQEVPFEKLVAELQPERSLSHSPLFQVMFTLQNAEGGGGALPGLQVGGVGAAMEIAKFDLSLTFVATPQGLFGGLNYNTDLFERGTIERMLGHLARVMEQVAADADVRLSRLELAGPEERARVVVEWNRTERPYPRGVCIHELFDAQVRERPDAAALVWGDESLTYRELDARANQLANHLVRLGVGPDARVGVLLERSAELVVSILAVIKAGGCYVPLDPGYPPERLRLMLADSSVRVLLSRGDLAEVVETGGLSVIHLDQAAGALASESAEAPRSGATPENLAYIVYTSGSTGKPKGVMVAHRHVVQLVVETDYVRFRPGDRVAQASNASFDALTFEAWGALMNGATLVGIPRDVLLSPAAFREMLREERITTLYQTTALLNQLSREQPDVFAPLRDVLFGGQAVDADSVRRLLKAGGPERLLHMYGPTETTAWCSWEKVEQVAEDALTVSVGRATGNQRIYLLDSALNPVPVGVPGEAYVGGDGVVRGYLDRPGLTAERFVPDPFAAEPGARMYRTGDRLRWKADGRLEFIGRVDEQVKIRGFRIEPGEIESVLSAHAEVREARVIVGTDASGEKRLVAYVVGGAEAEALRAHLRESLPEYMVPAAFVALERIPLTPNGKLDVKALPAPDLASAEDRYVAPRTPVEEVLAGIWAEVLKVERVGVHDNFFALGGHSLLAVTLVERMRRRGLRADVRALFVTPTVAELAAAAEGDVHEVVIPPNRIPAGCGAITPDMLPLVELTRAEIDRIVAGVPGGAGNVQDIYPLAPLQDGILFHHLLTPESDPYLLPQPFLFESREQLEAYLAALHAAVARHDILRTAVVWEGLSEPVQVVWRHAPLSVEEMEVDPAGPDVARQLYERIDALHYRMDLGRAPLLRAYVGREAVAGRWGLLLLLHHMVSDHTTGDVLREEMEAHLEGRADQLPAPLPFRNYVAQARLGVSRAEHEAFFRELLGDVDEPTAPFGLRQARGDGLGLEQRQLRVEEALGARLRERARRLGVSPAAVCHVAWAQVLARVSGRSDVVFGTVLFGRMEGGEGADRVLGPFINTLPARITVGEEGAEASVRRTQALLASLVRHEHASLALAQQCSAVPAPEPLFSAILNYRHASGGGGGGGGEGSARGPSQVLHVMERSNYPVNLAVNDLGEGFSLTVQAEAEAGAERVGALMHAALAGLVDALEQAPERPLHSIEVLPQAERREVLEEWNRTDAEYPADRCLHQLFEEQAARTPDAVALAFGEESLTYAELNARANRLAHHLCGLGVGPDARVGVCVERGVEMMVSILAVLKAGGAYVPLDPGLPAERLAYMLEDSAVPLVLTQAALRESVPVREGVEVLAVDALAARLAAESAENPQSGAGPDSLAYVIYTSGSTGRPKGVMNHHRGVVNLLWSMRGTVAMAPGDRLLAITTLAFDISVLELFLPLLSGARVEILDRSTASDPALLREAVAAGAGTVLQATPATWRLLLDAGWEGAEGLRALSGGEALPADLAARLRERVGALWNVYGPTETTIWSTAQPLGAGPDAGRGHVSIGAPVANTRVYVLDRYRSPVPAGVPGELYIGGAGVARGYLGRPGLSAEKFVPDPFAAQPGARLYRTGDLARWRRDGTLEFLGRNDHQVKVRGFRIELGEIEAALRGHEGVADCVVMARAEAGDPRLVAYVVGEAEAEALRAHVRRTLPEYMVPSAFVFLEALPLTPNGKLDRKALPAPELASGEETYVAPRTPTEEVLAGIWAEVLRLERVGVEESFFQLGGHSLLATRVVSRVREVFAVELPLRALFDGPTVAELAVRVEEMRRAELPVLPPVVPVERTGALPLSFAQERLWFIDRMEPESATYNIFAAWRLGGVLDEAALERALGEIVRRHEALRTVFREVDGSPVQVVAPFGGFTLPVHDLSALSEAEREAQTRLRLEGEAARPFDLSAGPLFRPALLRLDAENHVLLVGVHHILGDMGSMEVLRRELSALYAAYREGGESPLPEPAVQYADYAVWQREQLRGEVLERHLAYWKERLAGAPELLELPTDRPRPAVQTYRGAQEGITLSAELLARLEALGRGEGATLYMTLLGAFQVLLARYAGSEDVVVGSPVSGRTRREVEELIGLFLNTLVLRTDLSGDPPFRAVLRRVREATLGAFEHQEVPFERLVTELQPGRSLSYSPLFQVMFVLQEAERSAGAPGSPEMRSLGLAGSGTSKFDLTLFMVRHAGGLAASLEYNTDLFDRSTVRRMLRHLERVLEEVSADADVRLSRLALLEDAERRQVVAEWNATDAAYPRERCAHELFEAQAARTPDAVALRHAGGSLTYRELDERANRLARHLRGLGVGPDARVGLCLERGPELMVGVLGILKAGGAYVPLDPAYPAERLAYMLEDSAARVLLTQASLAERLPAGGAAVVRVDADAAAIGREAGERPGVPVGPGNLAYVIYTSGSTGRPKGVAMPHRPLVNLLAWQQASGRAPAGAVTLQYTSISFDVSFQEIFATWCAGGTLVLTSEEVRMDPPRLARLLDAERIERLFLPFIALQHLAEACVELGIAPASLGEVITAGEQLRVTEPIRRWFAGMPGCVLVNQYGPSETHVVSARVLEGEPAEWPLLPSIGAPVANTGLYVLDPHLEPAPIGVPGELLLGGDAVARGYLERPGLTAERFLPDPFGAPGGRLYRTGDRARWLPGGEVEYLGRTDEQVKVRGFRIEPGEVEAVLSDHPGVRAVVVVVREDAPGDRRLVAYVVAGEPEAATPAGLRAHLKGRLPEYMVPSAVVVLDSLPLTPSGKVARRALPAPEYAAAEETYVAPRTPVEEVLAGIWAEVLRLERVGVHDNFFDLGGHSLLIMRLLAGIQGTFDLEISIRTVFSMPTLEAMAGEIERRIYEDAATMSEYEAEQLAESNPFAGA